VVQRAKVPVIVLNLSPEEAIGYEAFNKMKDRTILYHTRMKIQEVYRIKIR